MSELVDYTAVMQVIGCLMKDTLLLAQIDRYHLDVKDFPNKFTKILFSAINNIALNGARTISVIDIDNYIGKYLELKGVFESNNGIKYLQDCEEISDINNYEYYYSRVKKFSALRALQKVGFDISDFYVENILDKNYDKIQSRFDELSLKEIFESIKKKFFSIEEGYGISASTGAIDASKGLRELKDLYKLRPEIGPPLQGDYFNSICRGARKGKYYLRSSSSGSGKTRLAVGDACNLAFPTRYDTINNCWVEAPYSEKVLFITTELDYEEVQTMILAWITGINEKFILIGRYTPEEEIRVNDGIEIIEKYKDNFILERIPDPSISQIEAVVRKQVLTNQIQSVFYDYIFSSPSLFNEFKGAGIREDVVLTLLSTALKDLAVELNIFMMSSSQLSGDYENKTGIRNQNFLRNSKALADKCDIGVVSLNINQEEKTIIEKIAREVGCPVPNYVTDVYKTRRSQYKNIKIWSLIDLGTCKIIDLFVTDGYYNRMSGIEILKYGELTSNG